VSLLEDNSVLMHLFSIGGRRNHLTIGSRRCLSKKHSW